MRCKIGWLLFGLLLSLGAQATVREGEVPPATLGVDARGQALDLPALRGKVVVLSFWATWCRYCLKEIPTLVNMQNVADEKHAPLQIVLINSKEDRNIFRGSSRLFRKQAPGILSTWDRKGEVGLPYGSNKSIPVMVMLRKDGTVAHLHVGYSEDALDSLVAEINALLNEPAGAAGSG